MHYGDADLCVSSFKPNASFLAQPIVTPPGIMLGDHMRGQGWGLLSDVGSGMVLPTMQSATWRSMHYGNDSVQIEYDDPNFCSDCTYVVGVFGYMNSTYTILVSTSLNQVIRLMVSMHIFDFHLISYHTSYPII